MSAANIAAMDAAHVTKRVPSPTEQIAGLSLDFGGPKISLTELVERVRIDPPSVPVRSSERGADRAKKRQPAQHARIIAELAKAGCLPGSGKYLSREAIAKRCDTRETAMCGRLGPSGGLLMPDGKDAGPWAIRRKADACTSEAGEHVFGYQLTDYGMGLLAEAGIRLEPRK